MTFAIANSIYGVIMMMSIYRLAMSVRHKRIATQDSVLLFCAYMFVWFLVQYPVLHDMMQAAALQNGHAVKMNDPYDVLAAIFFGGLLSVLIFWLSLLRSHRTNTGSFLKIGGDVIACVIGLYMMIVAGDQLSFIYRDKPNAGYVNWEFYQQEGHITDMKCDQEIMLVTEYTPQNVTYRCPTSIVLARFSNMPIIPWPAYVEGKSPQLAAVMTKTRESAIKLGDKKDAGK